MSTQILLELIPKTFKDKNGHNSYQIQDSGFDQTTSGINKVGSFTHVGREGTMDCKLYWSPKF